MKETCYPIEFLRETRSWLEAWSEGGKAGTLWSSHIEIVVGMDVIRVK